MDKETSSQKPEKKKEEKPRKSTTQTKKTKSEPLVYVGPNIRVGALSRFTILRDEVPTHISNLIKDQPEIELLIVPASKLINALSRIEKTGTREASAYKKLKGSEK